MNVSLSVCRHSASFSTFVTIFFGLELGLRFAQLSNNRLSLSTWTKFKRAARLLDLPPLADLPPYEQLQFALGNPQPQLFKKPYHLWLELAVPRAQCESSLPAPSGSMSTLAGARPIRSPKSKRVPRSALSPW